MTQYLPYISLVMAIAGIIYARGKQDKTYESELTLIKSRLDDVQKESIKRINNRIDDITGRVNICVSEDKLKERLERMERKLDGLSKDMRSVCLKITRLEAGKRRVPDQNDTEDF